MMSTLGVGIIGCGNISAAYMKLIPMFKNLQLIAVADIHAPSAEARAEEFGLEVLSVDALLADERIQAVVNLTIPDVHYQVTRQILEAGKHAYSEKPLTLTFAEAEELKALAAKLGLRVGCAPDTFLGGAHQTLRQAIDQGKLGKVVSGTCHILSRGMEMWHPNPDFFFKPGAGPVFDMGPYYITNLVQMLGPVKAVSAMTSQGFDERTITNGPRDGESVPVSTPTTINALLQFDSGAQITLGASWDVSAHRHKEMELYGTEASAYATDPNFFGGDVLVTRFGEEAETLDPAGHPLTANNFTDNGGNQRPNYRGAGLADMAQGILEGRPHRCSLELAAHVVEVMESILKAGETRQWIDLQSSCERPALLDTAAAQALLKS